MKCTTRIVSLVLTIFLFLGSFSMTAHAAGGQMKTGIGFITAWALRLRSGPDSGSSTLAYGAKDEVVVILGKTGQWYRVIYNLQEGYMHEDYLRVSQKENAELGYGRVNGTSVNVRSGAGTSYGSVGKANTGDKVYILGINDGWFRVIHGSIIGYIRSDFVDLTEVPYENQASANKPLFFVGGKSTGLQPSASALNGSSAQQIIATAKKYLGVPYVWGGSTPKGFDCSGFVQYVFHTHGIYLPRTSSQQYTVGKYVKRSELQPGDLVFFGTTGVSHLGIYIGENQFIHASSSKGVTITNLSNSYWAVRYYGARRVL